MIRQELIDKVSSQIEKLQREYKEENKEAEFYDEFTKIVNINSVQTLLNVPLSDFVIASLNVELKEEDFLQVYEEGKQFADIIDKFSPKELDTIDAFFTFLLTVDELDSFQDALHSEKKGFFSLLSSIHLTGALMMKGFQKLCKVHDCDEEDLAPFIRFYREYPDTIRMILDSVKDIKKIKDYVEVFKTGIEEYEEEHGSKVRTKIQTKILNDELMRNYPMNSLYEMLHKIRDYRYQLSTDISKKKRQIQKTMNAYQNLLDCLDSKFLKDEVVDYRELLSGIDEEEIRLLFLRYVYEHNSQYYQELESSYQSLYNHSETRYFALLQGYSISKDSIHMSCVMKKSYEEIEKMLIALNSMNLGEKNISYILEVSDLDRVIKIKDFASLGYISLNGMISHLSLFDINDSSYDEFYHNIQFLQNNGINPELFGNEVELFISNPYFQKILCFYKVMIYIEVFVMVRVISFFFCLLWKMFLIKY